MVRNSTFRSLALALPDAVELPHHDRASFRRQGRIFATLAEGEEQGVVKLPLEQQGVLVESEPDIFFLPGWNKQGWTGIRLPLIERRRLQQLLKIAWEEVG